MRYLFVTALSACLLLGMAQLQAAGVEAEVNFNGGNLDIGVFKDSLRSDGRWFHDDRYGEVWQPNVVVENKDWRPYDQDGHWVYTDDGWMWESDYTWGWAPFHYGRWFREPERGWVWVPGDEWAPAWVTWRSADDVYGWAPLPPEAQFEVGVGFRGGLELNLAPDAYTFVPAGSFLSANIATVALPEVEVRNVYNRTRVVENAYESRDHRVVNRGIPVQSVARETHRDIHPIQVTNSNQPGRARKDQNEISVYRPNAKRENRENANRQPLNTSTREQRAEERNNVRTQQETTAQRRLEQEKQQTEQRKAQQVQQQREQRQEQLNEQRNQRSEERATNQAQRQENQTQRMEQRNENQATRENVRENEREQERNARQQREQVQPRQEQHAQPRAEQRPATHEAGNTGEKERRE